MDHPGNLTCLLRTLDDHEPVLFLAVAAGHAPEASAVSDAVWNQATPTAMRHLDEETAVQSARKPRAAHDHVSLKWRASRSIVT